MLRRCKTKIVATIFRMRIQCKTNFCDVRGGERTELQNKKRRRATTLIKYENLLNCFYVAQL